MAYLSHHTKFENIMLLALAGAPLNWMERCYLHQKLRTKLLAGRTVVHCAACSRLIHADETTLEHIVPRSLGGGYEPWNLTLTCHRCNHKRGNMYDFWVWRVMRHEKARHSPTTILTWTP